MKKFIGVLLVLAIGVAVYLFVTQNEPDLRINAAFHMEIYHGELEELISFGEENLAGSDGDGRIKVVFSAKTNMCAVETPYPQVLGSVCGEFYDGQSALFLLDTLTIEALLERERELGKPLFEPLAALGLASNCEYPFAVRVDQTALFQGIPHYDSPVHDPDADFKIFAVFPVRRDGSPSDAEYRLAAQYVRALIEE